MDTDIFIGARLQNERERLSLSLAPSLTQRDKCRQHHKYYKTRNTTRNGSNGTCADKESFVTGGGASLTTFVAF